MDLAALLVGLGNPGAEYAGTRHNFGFLLIDALLAACAAAGAENVQSLSVGKGKLAVWKCRFPASGEWRLLAKPLTFMNNSGEAVAPLLHYYRLSPQQLWVAQDELDLPLGRMRYQFGGSGAGHKGIASIVAQTGTHDFHRLRLGIGKPAGYDTISYVLGRFSAAEKNRVAELLDALVLVLLQGAALSQERLQQTINSFRLSDAHAVSTET